MGFDIISLLDRYGNNIRGHLVAILVSDDAVDLAAIHVWIITGKAGIVSSPLYESCLRWKS